MVRKVNYRTGNRPVSGNLFAAQGITAPELSVHIKHTGRFGASSLCHYIGNFYERLVTELVGGVLGSIIGTDEIICPDVLVVRDDREILVEVKSGRIQRYHKVDKGQLKYYAECGQPVEYAFVDYGFGSKDTFNSRHDIQTHGDVCVYLASAIKRVVLVDAVVLKKAVDADLFTEFVCSQSQDGAWSSASGENLAQVHQKFLRSLASNNGWAHQSGVRKSNYVWKTQQVSQLQVSVYDVAFEIAPFDFVSVVRKPVQRKVSNEKVPF